MTFPSTFLAWARFDWFSYKATKQKRQIPLILVENNYDEDDEDDETPYKFHYAWIKNFFALCNSQISKNGHKKHTYERCFQAYFIE